MLYGRREQACLFPAKNKTTINSIVETGFHPRLKKQKQAQACVETPACRQERWPPRKISVVINDLKGHDQY